MCELFKGFGYWWAGFIGSHLVDRLVSEGFDVIVLDDFSGGRRENLSGHFGEANFCLVEVDVRKDLDVVDVCSRVLPKREKGFMRCLL